MDDASRYQNDFDLMMQELDSEALRRENIERETMWRHMERGFNEFAERKKLSPADYQRLKKHWLDVACQTFE